MPAKSLPKKLVNRLEAVAPVIDRYLGSMKNIDYRKRGFSDPKDISSWGYRVRQMNVSRNYPGVELVIKKAHFSVAAKSEIKKIQKRVMRYNGKTKRLIGIIKNKGKKRNHVLREPIAYDIGNGLVAMAKTNKPSLSEVLGIFKINDDVSEHRITARGTGFFRKLSREHGVTKAELKIGAKQVFKGTRIHPVNIILLGANKKGEFILMPFIDLV